MPYFQPVVDGVHIRIMPVEVLKDRLRDGQNKSGFGRYIGGIMQGDAGHHIQSKIDDPRSGQRCI